VKINKRKFIGKTCLLCKARFKETINIKSSFAYMINNFPLACQRESAVKISFSLTSKAYRDIYESLNGFTIQNEDR